MRVPLLGLALLTLACGSDSGTGPNGPNLDGTYVLKMVDNKGLPVAFPDSSLVSGQLVLSDSGWSQISRKCSSIAIWKAQSSCRNWSPPRRA